MANESNKNKSKTPEKKKTTSTSKCMTKAEKARIQAELEAENVLKDREMSAARNRKKFRESLNSAKYNGFKYIHYVPPFLYF